MDLDLDQARRQAKELLRSAKSGDARALARLRSDRTARLADAQAAVARELGFPSWPALVAGVPDDARSSERAPIAQLVDEIRDMGHDYLPGRPVRVRVRVRGTNIYVDDLGGAVAVAGMPPGWLDAARQAVAELDWNVRRSGVVFMQAPRGRALEWIISRTAEASVAVCDAILRLADEGVGLRGLYGTQP